MKLKRFTTFFMALVLVLGMSPVLKASARVASESYTFTAYENTPRFTVDVTCHARLNGRRLEGSFSYSYPQASHYDHPEQYITGILLGGHAGPRAHLQRFYMVNYATISLNFDPYVAEYYFALDGKEEWSTFFSN